MNIWPKFVMKSVYHFSKWPNYLKWYTLARINITQSHTHTQSRIWQWTKYTSKCTIETYAFLMWSSNVRPWYVLKFKLINLFFHTHSQAYSIRSHWFIRWFGHYWDNLWRIEYEIAFHCIVFRRYARKSWAYVGRLDSMIGYRDAKTKRKKGICFDSTVA